MSVPSIISLGIATVAIVLSLNIRDEVFKVGIACIATLSVALTIIFAPWSIKIAIVLTPIVREKLQLF